MAGAAAEQAHLRMIASDLDGTLLRRDGTISAYTHAVLRQVRAYGVVFVLVTARPPRVAREIAARLDVDGLAICCNGALVYDLDAGRIVRHAPLAAEVASRIVTALRVSVPGVCFAIERELGFSCEPAWLELSRKAATDVQSQGDALHFCAQPVTKLMARHPNYPVERLSALAHDAGAGAALVTISGAPFVEIGAVGVHKAAALADLCAERGIAPEAVVAFGDMPNDLPMLRWAGRGVAVANAHPDVLAAADVVTESNEEDGVARELARLFGLDRLDTSARE